MLALGQNRCLPNPTHFIFHHSSHNSTPYTLDRAPKLNNAHIIIIIIIWPRAAKPTCQHTEQTGTELSTKRLLYVPARKRNVVIAVAAYEQTSGRVVLQNALSCYKKERESIRKYSLLNNIQNCRNEWKAHEWEEGNIFTNQVGKLSFRGPKKKGERTCTQASELNIKFSESRNNDNRTNTAYI
jgi:hypothetical protein